MSGGLIFGRCRHAQPAPAPVYLPPAAECQPCGGANQGGVVYSNGTTVVPGTYPAGAFVQPSQPQGQMNGTLAARIDTDPAALATSTHDGAQSLVTAMTRSSLATDTQQKVNWTRPAQYGGISHDSQWLKLDKDGQLLEWTSNGSAQSTWQKSASTTLLFCDELGIVRTRDGKEIGRLGIEPELAKQLQLRETSDQNTQGVFLAFENHLSSCTFYPKSDGPMALPPVLFNPADRQLGGQSVVMAIGMPPGALDGRVGYNRQLEAAEVTRVERDQNGPVGTLQVPSVAVEAHFNPQVHPTSFEARRDELKGLLRRTEEQMRTTDEVRDTAGTVTRAGGQRWEYLTLVDQQTGQPRRQAFGVNSDGSLLTYVGNTGTQEEQTKGNGWRNCEASGMQHLFIREDFTVVNKKGEHVGNINPNDLRKEDLEYKKQADGSTSGIFLQREIPIVMKDGKTVYYNPGAMKMGETSALIQFGTPPELQSLKLKPVPAPATAELLAGLATDGGLIAEPSRAVTGSNDKVRHYLSQGGAMRITIDESGVNRELLTSLNKRLDELVAEKRNNGSLTSDQMTEALSINDQIAKESANVKVLVDRRCHVFSRSYGAFDGQPSRLAVWRREPGFQMTYEELLVLYPSLGKSPPRQTTPKQGGIIASAPAPLAEAYAFRN